MQKIVVCIMGQNCERFIGMCLDSVKDANAIVYCDGGSNDFTQAKVITFEEKNKKKVEYITNEFNQEDKTMNGKQRNFYLQYLKEHYPDYWCLCLDTDEVVEDLSKIKQFIQAMQKGVYSVKMRHLIGDLGHEDTTVSEHYVFNRLFHVSCVDKYPEAEHSVLIPKSEFKETYTTKCTTIWHLAYCSGMWDIKKRYENHVKKSNIHTPEYLRGWYKAHLFGNYPKKSFDPVELPKQLLDEFGIDRDELYFEKRKSFNTNHFIDAFMWKKFFKPNSATLYGCGIGQRVFCLNQIGVDACGIELSKYAVENAMDEEVRQGDILNKEDIYFSDLVVAYDILEHLSYDDLPKAINNLVKSANKYILISVPFLGDPNLENDPTHIIKEDKAWWITQFDKKGLSYIPVPEHFLFKDQIIIFKKEDKK